MSKKKLFDKKPQGTFGVGDTIVTTSQKFKPFTAIEQARFRGKDLEESINRKTRRKKRQSLRKKVMGK